MMMSEGLLSARRGLPSSHCAGCAPDGWVRHFSDTRFYTSFRCHRSTGRPKSWTPELPICLDVDTSPCDLARAVSAASMTSTKPSEEQVEDLLLSCRYGDLDEVKAFVQQFGVEPVQQARDDRGNNVLHMCCGNGHAGE